MRNRIKGLFLGLAALIAVLMVSGLMAYQHTRALREDAAWVAHTYEVLDAIQVALTAVDDAETGQRGYLITRSPRYLEPYQAAVARVPRDLQRMKDLVQDNPRQERRIRELEQRITAKLEELQQTIAMEGQDPAAARRMVETHLGRNLMEAIRGQVAAMTGEEQALLAQRALRSRASYRMAVLSGGLFALLGLGLALAFVLQLRRHLDQRERHERALELERQWLRVTLNSIGDALIATDRAGVVTFMNPVAETLTGWSSREAAGQPLATVFRIQNELTGAPAANPADRVLAEGVVVGLANHTALVSRSGQAIPIEDSAAPILDAAGTVSGVVLVFHDVTARRSAEDGLLQSEHRFRTLTQLSPDAIWVNRDDRIEMVNAEALHLLGAASADQVEGRSPFDFFHPDCHDLVRARLRTVRDGQTVQGSMETIVRLDGSLRQVEVSAAPLVDAQGPAVQAVLRDVTERQQRDRELEQLNRSLRALSRSNQALMRSETMAESAYLEEICDIITVDCGHAMVWVGYREDGPARTIRAIAAAGFEDGYLETARLTWDDEERGRGPTGTAIRTGKPGMCRDTWTDPTFAPWRAEARKRGFRSSLALPLLSGGAAFGAITFYSRHLDAFGDAEVALLQELTGDLAYGITTNRLRAEHVRAEAALVESEQRFRTAFEQGAIPMAMSDLDGTLLRVNPALAQMLGYPEAALKGRAVWEITHPEDQAANWDGIARMVRGGAPGFRMEKRYLHQDGAVIWGDMSTAVVPDAQGRPLYLVTHIQDITERKRIEAERLEANRRKDEFLATLAHELRNPLAPIRTATFILAQRPSLDPEIRQIHEMIARQAAHMARLVDDLLDVARVEQGKMELLKTRVELGQTLVHALEACKPNLEARSHRLTVALPQPDLELEADPVRLEQMVCNLVNNACKCTPKGGEIRVSAVLEGTEAVLSVRDNGIGMAPEVVAHVFELFYQAGQALDRPEGGLGIGLTLVQRLARMHGGSISARSEGPGQGSEFLLRLPVLAPAPRRPDPGGVRGGLGRPAHVLIVDDDLNIRETTSMLLKAAGYRVSTAATGTRGIEQARALRPDIAIIDLCMPGLNGVEVATQIRADLGPEIHLVALTGYSRESDLALTRQAGFDQHLVKSGDPEILLGLLRTLALRSPAPSSGAAPK